MVIKCTPITEYRTEYTVQLRQISLMYLMLGSVERKIVSNARTRLYSVNTLANNANKKTGWLRCVSIFKYLYIINKFWFRIGYSMFQQKKAKRKYVLGTGT